MKAVPLIIASGWLLTAGAHAQQNLPERVSEPAQIEKRESSRPDPFAGSHQPYPRVYAADVAALPNDHLLKGYRRDPRLIFGAEVAPHVAIEGGYVNAPDRGLYKIDPTLPKDAAHALGEQGSSNHLGVKYSLPEGERLSAYGKVGVAYSVVKENGLSRSDTGLYTGAGARLKVDRNTSIGAEVSRHGNAAKKLGDVISDGLRGSVNLGF